MSLTVEIRKQLGDFSLCVSFETDSLSTGLLGPSGCGKSVTLRCIAGIERPDSGRIVLDGRTLFDSDRGIFLPPQKRQVGFLFQQPSLFPHMTVEQNILCGFCKEKDKKRRRERFTFLTSLLRLENVLSLRPAALSGGQAQRASLARSLAAEPKLLLLDEPFSSLDPCLREELQGEFQTLLPSVGCRTLFVTHDRDEAYLLCPRLCIMDHGRILQTGSREEVFSFPESETAARLTGCKNTAPAVKAGTYLVFVPRWQIYLKTAVPVPDTLRAVGIHAHGFSGEGKENCFPIRLCGSVQKPFKTAFLFRFESQEEDSPPLWWTPPPGHGSSFPGSHVCIRPDQTLLLT